MRQIVTALCALLTLSLFSGCERCPPIPQRCIIPDTKEPTIINAKCDDDDYSCIAEKALMNYVEQKKYSETLKKNSEVCK